MNSWNQKRPSILACFLPLHVPSENLPLFADTDLTIVYSINRAPLVLLRRIEI
jgi:hypothetical protein